MKHTKLDDAALNFIRENCEAMTSAEMAKHLGVTEPAIRYRLVSMGLAVKHVKQTYTDNEDKFIIANHEMPNRYIAQKLGRDINSIKHRKKLLRKKQQLPSVMCQEAQTSRVIEDAIKTTRPIDRATGIEHMRFGNSSGRYDRYVPAVFR